MKLPSSYHVTVFGATASINGHSAPKRFASHPLPSPLFLEATLSDFPDQPLILLVGAQGLEPWTR
jgi:hypothetical protein